MFTVESELKRTSQRLRDKPLHLGRMFGVSKFSVHGSGISASSASSAVKIRLPFEDRDENPEPF